MTAGFWEVHGVTDHGWRDGARCRDTGPGPWFPVGGGGRHGETTDELEFQQAQECGPCEVRESCLWYALTHKIEHGVWGGKTALQRRVFLRAMQRDFRQANPEAVDIRSPRPVPTIAATIDQATRDSTRKATG